MNVYSLSKSIMNLQPTLTKTVRKSSGKRMDSSIYSWDLVINKAVYNKDERQYELSVDDLTESQQNEFASLILSDDQWSAAETTGPDNASWLKTMLPALINLLRDSSSKENEQYFLSSWKKGITKYLEFQMQQLINESLSQYNFQHKLAVTRG